ncbi:MAG: hypothetical protein EZS26_000750 [Candidatus Ordinivivax streblomastigis]|uniref:DUF5681 domain-containing protein n=1 Tax=Candidatus Ordinivivax streblomastigis TaxID=2540710 RepID=A0A5M8P3S1_9BACT|nr:MAG: hypothetical protein EZS26_000750 [Candidatus Ordinivivax streblomastigis]
MPNPNPNISGLKPPFKKGESGNPEGRPKSRVPDALKIVLGKKKAKKFYQLNEIEVNEWEAAVLTMTANELKTLASWEDANSYAKGLAISILFDMKSGNTKTLDKLRERQYGKAVQKVELTGKDGADLMPARVLSKSEAKELLEGLNNEF